MEFRQSDSKSAHDVLSLIFLLKKPLPFKKNVQCYFIFYYKNSNTSQFHAFKITNDFGNASESSEFRFENSLNKYLLTQIS